MNNVHRKLNIPLVAGAGGLAAGVGTGLLQRNKVMSSMSPQEMDNYKDLEQKHANTYRPWKLNNPDFTPIADISTDKLGFNSYILPTAGTVLGAGAVGGLAHLYNKSKFSKFSYMN